VSFIFDPSAYTNIANGLEIALQFPSGMLVNGNTVNVSEFSCKPANGYPGYVAPDPDAALWDCLAYYLKTFGQTIAPAQAAGNAGALSYLVQIASTTVGNLFDWRFPRPMIQTPTMTTYNPGAANTKWRNATAAGDSGTPTVGQLLSDAQCDFYNPQVAGDATGQIVAIHATANAELV
jgi:hypothetical protein